MLDTITKVTLKIKNYDTSCIQDENPGLQSLTRAGICSICHPIQSGSLSLPASYSKSKQRALQWGEEQPAGT